MEAMEGDGTAPTYWLPAGNALHSCPPPKKVSPPQFLHYCIRPAPAGPLKRLEYRTCRRRRPTDSNKLHFLGASSSFKTIGVFRKLSPRMVFAGNKLQSRPDIFGTLRHLICTRRCVQTSNMKIKSLVSVLC